MNPYAHKEYFEWLCMLVGANEGCPFYPYHNLLVRLFQTDFEITDTRAFDTNRAVNGKHLRYYFDSNRDDFGSNNPSAYHRIGDFYNITQGYPCSMLEMLIALAKDIDTQYLYSSDCRLLIWFWIMIESMGLANMLDGKWDEQSDRSEVDWILRAFNLDAYEFTEDGDYRPTVLLFPIRNIEGYQQVRNLWEQMTIWYNQNINYLDSLTINIFIDKFINRYFH